MYFYPRRTKRTRARDKSVLVFARDLLLLLDKIPPHSFHKHTSGALSSAVGDVNAIALSKNDLLQLMNLANARLFHELRR